MSYKNFKRVRSVLLYWLLFGVLYGIYNGWQGHWAEGLIAFLPFGLIFLAGRLTLYCWTEARWKDGVG